MPAAAANSRAVAAAALAACCALPIAAPPRLAAQRVVERHPWGDAEGRLMGYYSAALAFSPAAAPAETAGARTLTVGVELSLVPPLSEANRTGGFSKTESTNLAPVLPRPRLSLALPGGLVVEGSWVPPVRVFDVTANLAAVAVSRTAGRVGPLALTPRVALSTGTVTGAVTCNRELFDRGGGDSLYFEKVCHGRESRDQFRPRAASVELLAAPPGGAGRWRRLHPYAGGGVRAERTRFDVNVLGFDGSPDPTYPSLELRVTRGYAFAGATWVARGRAPLLLSAELFYAPGSLVTVRTQGALPLSLGGGGAAAAARRREAR